MKSITVLSQRVLLPGLLALALIWLVTIRVPTALWIGGFTLNAFMTGLAALLAGFLALCTLTAALAMRSNPDSPGGKAPTLFVLAAISGLPFLVYSAIALATSFRIEGLQNGLVWVAFSATLFAAPYWLTPRGSTAIVQTMRVVVVVVPLTKIVIFLLGTDFYGEASYALVGVVLMVWAVAHTPRGLFDYAAPWLLLVSILLCDVRTAAVVAAVLIIFTARHLPVATWIKGALAALFALASAVLVWFFVGNRFLDSGDQGLGRFFGEGSILARIGTTNRAEAWAHLFQQLPSGINWFGQGPGLSSFLVDELLAIHHPHNEYLRIFFDFGWVGLTLFLAGNLVLWIALVGLYRKRADDGVFASILLLPAIALLAVTDNPFVFAYVMLPAALILSLSLAKEINPQARAQTALVANPHR